jgi:hypothetical protein
MRPFGSDSAHGSEASTARPRLSGEPPQSLGLVPRGRKADRASGRLSGGGTPKITISALYRDAMVRRTGMRRSPLTGGGRRSRITEFTSAARTRLRLAVRNIPGLNQLLGLTYPRVFPGDGSVVKGDWAAMRKFLVRRGFSGVWWLEFQMRGAPHLHVLLRGPAVGWKLREDISVAWFRIVASGDERHLRAGTRCERVRDVEGILDYAAKNSSKGVPKGFEHVGRFWGTFGGARVVPVAVVAGPAEQVAPLARAVRRGRRAKSRSDGRRQPRRDPGDRGFTAWGSGPLAADVIQRMAGSDGEDQPGEEVSGDGIG